GDYVRLWVPELQGIRGADVHTPWALSSAAVSQAGVTLGETYPHPAVTAPEWSRHSSQRPQGRSPHPRGRRGPAHVPAQHEDSGIASDFSHKKDV
ncbi:CRYD protein, partial [Rhynochetos jubatus]|nr:CRYD protein [Rhynochetos jubatus]